MSTISARSWTATRSPTRAASRRSRTPASGLRYATSEQQVRSIPFFTFSGTSDYWNPKVQEDVYIKSQIGRYRVRGYGGARTLPHLSDLAFKCDLSSAGTAGDPVAAVEMYTEIGGLNGATAAQALDAGDDRADELRCACRAPPSRRWAWHPAWPALPRTPAKAA